MQSKRLISLFLILAMMATLFAFPSFAAVVVGNITKADTADTPTEFSAADFSGAINQAATDATGGIDSVTFPALPGAADGVLVIKTGTGAGATSTNVAEGTPVLAADLGKLVFNPASGVTGLISFGFFVTIDGEDSNTANIQITYTAAPAPTDTDDDDDDDETPFVPLKYADLWHGTAQTHWCYTSAGSLAELGLVVGEKLHGGNYYFHPDEYITRGEFAMWTNAVMQINLSANTTSLFEDVKAAYQIAQFNAAKEKGYVSGTSVGTKLYFYPERTLNRAEAIRIINNAIGGTPDTTTTLTYIDKNTIPSWAVDSAKKLTGLKIIQGDKNNRLNPLTTIKRSEAAEMLYKLYKEKHKETTPAA